MKQFFYENIRNINGQPTSRIRSSLFYWAGALIGSMSLLFLDSDRYGDYALFGLLTLMPSLLLYPIIRMLLGGKDSVIGVVGTAAIQEVIKGKILNKKND